MKNFLKLLVAGLLIATSLFIVLSSCKAKADKDYLKNVSWTAVDMPHSFKHREAEKLSVKAFDLKKGGYFNQAIPYYGKAIQIEPDNPRLYFDISECFARANRLKLAIVNVDSAIVLDPTYPTFYNNRGLSYYHLYEDEKAIADFEKATQLDDKNPDFYYNLSIGYYSAKRLDKACTAFHQAKKLGLDINEVKDQVEAKSLLQLCK